MIELWDMQDHVKVIVSEKVGENILRFNNYNNGGRYIPIKEFSRHFDLDEEPEEPQKLEAIEEDLSVSGSPITTEGTVTLNTNVDAVTFAKMQSEEVVKPKAEPKKRATRKPKTNQKTAK